MASSCFWAWLLRGPLQGPRLFHDISLGLTRWGWTWEPKSLQMFLNLSTYPNPSPTTVGTQGHSVALPFLRSMPLPPRKGHDLALYLQQLTIPPMSLVQSPNPVSSPESQYPPCHLQPTIRLLGSFLGL